MSRTSVPPPSSAVRPIDARATVRQAYDSVFGRAGLLVTAAAVPLMLSMAIEVLSFYGHGAALLLTLLSFIPYTLFAVAWHRVTLLGPAAAAPRLMPSWSVRHWRFLGYSLAVMLISFLVWIPFGAAFGVILSRGQGMEMSPGQAGLLMILGLAVALGFGYLSMRLSFVFPAVAVDENYRLTHTWAHTRGQGFRLLWTVILAAIPMVAVLWILGAALSAYLAPEVTGVGGSRGAPAGEDMRDFMATNPQAIFLAQIIISVVNYVFLAVVISTISIAFRTATGWVPEADAANKPAKS